MQLDRVVLDSNFYITLLINKKAEELVYFSVEKEIEIFTCTEQLKEILNTLSYPKFKNLYAGQATEYLKFIKKYSTTTEIDLRFDRAPDIKDNYLFDLCYSIKSYYLVTGDKPLQNMKSVNKIQIISPTAFRKLLSEK